MDPNVVESRSPQIQRVVPKDKIGPIVSNIGMTTDFSANDTSNSASHTAFVQTSLVEKATRHTRGVLQSRGLRCAGFRPPLPSCPLAVLGDSQYLSVFKVEQLRALALLFLKLHAQGSNIELEFSRFTAF